MAEPSSEWVEIVHRSLNLAVGVGPIPGRKSIGVTVRAGSVIHTVAYCRDIESARTLRDALLAIVFTEGDHRADG